MSWVHLKDIKSRIYVLAHLLDEYVVSLYPLEITALCSVLVDLSGTHLCVR